MPKHRGFRGWFYFRMGWSTYFAFILAAINTLTVTFYLAIEKYPLLEFIFPTFIHYVVIIGSVGVPLLITIGYVHFKRSAARRAEMDVSYETNPYFVRTLTNTQVLVSLNMKLIEIILKLSIGEKLSKEEIANARKLQEELNDFISQRTFKNKMDLEFFKKLESTTSI